MTRGIPLSAMDRVIREVGVDRVSDDAKAALKEALEEKGKEIARRALQIAKHADKTTIQKSDVLLGKDE